MKEHFNIDKIEITLLTIYFFVKFVLFFEFLILLSILQISCHGRN